MNLDCKTPTGMKNGRDQLTSYSFYVIFLLVDYHEGSESATACQGKSQECEVLLWYFTSRQYKEVEPPYRYVAHFYRIRGRLTRL